MLLALLTFYYDVFIQTCVSHYFREDLILDDDHPYYRRYTEKHRKKREVVKLFWIVAGSLMLIFQSLHMVIALALFTTFLSFAYLDEALS